MYPPNAITVTDNFNASGTATTLIDSSSFPDDKFTVLSLHVTADGTNSLNSTNTSCGTQGVLLTTARMATNVPAIRVNLTDGNIVCLADLTLTANGPTQTIFYTVTYLPFDVNSTTTPTQVTYNDWMLTASVIIFLLSFITAGYFWSIFKPKKHDTY